MVFSCIPFVFFFLPLFLILYFAVPFSWKIQNRFFHLNLHAKNGILLVFSLVFYAWGEPVYILLMLFSTALDYGNGRLMERFGTTKGRRLIFLCCSVCVNLSLLAFFKYADFAVSLVNGLTGLDIPLPGIRLPIGISFYTFQTMSYVIDLYRGEVEAEHSYLSYLTYVSMFPQLVAGPIVRFSDISVGLHERKITAEEMEKGLLRFMMGLFKKVLLANQTGALWEEIRLLGADGGVGALTAWLGAACFTLQLYLDFSAYSDMAIGMGRMIGFRFHENFRYPLTAVSVTDFWRRWHISLSTWFRDYVYIPLGGNRRGTARHLLAIAVVWFLTGLWHGASLNFILWGMYYGLLLALEKYAWGKALGSLPRGLRHLYALSIIVFGFVIFAITDMRELSRYVGFLFSFSSGRADGRFLWYVRNYGAVLAASVVVSCPAYPWLAGKLSRLGGRAGVAASVFSCACAAALFLLSTAYMVSDTYNPFLYFRF